MTQFFSFRLVTLGILFFTATIVLTPSLGSAHAARNTSSSHVDYVAGSGFLA